MIDETPADEVSLDRVVRASLPRPREERQQAAARGDRLVQLPTQGAEAEIRIRHDEPPLLRIGRAELACVSMSEAVAKVRHLAHRDVPTLVVTANSDHIVRLEVDERLAAAYAAADLALVDGRPLVWAGGLMSRRTERITGIDLFEALCALQDAELRIFLLGGSERNSARAVRLLSERFPRLRIVGRNTVWVDETASVRIAEEIRCSGANLVAVFYGCPKQEIWVDEHRGQLPPAAYLCLGGTIDIISGALPRAGRVWQALGLEWLHRLLLEPRRLWRRYLVDDPKFFAIALRSIRSARR